MGRREEEDKIFSVKPPQPAPTPQPVHSPHPQQPQEYQKQKVFSVKPPQQPQQHQQPQQQQPKPATAPMFKPPETYDDPFREGSKQSEIYYKVHKDELANSTVNPEWVQQTTENMRANYEPPEVQFVPTRYAPPEDMMDEAAMLEEAYNVKFVQNPDDLVKEAKTYLETTLPEDIHKSVENTLRLEKAGVETSGYTEMDPDQEGVNPILDAQQSWIEDQRNWNPGDSSAQHVLEALSRPLNRMQAGADNVSTEDRKDTEGGAYQPYQTNWGEGEEGTEGVRGYVSQWAFDPQAAMEEARETGDEFYAAWKPAAKGMAQEYDSGEIADARAEEWEAEGHDYDTNEVFNLAANIVLDPVTWVPVAKWVGVAGKGAKTVGKATGSDTLQNTGTALEQWGKNYNAGDKKGEKLADFEQNLADKVNAIQTSEDYLKMTPAEYDRAVNDVIKEATPEVRQKYEDMGYTPNEAKKRAGKDGEKWTAALSSQKALHEGAFGEKIEAEFISQQLMDDITPAYNDLVSATNGMKKTERDEIAKALDTGGEEFRIQSTNDIVNELLDGGKYMLDPTSDKNVFDEIARSGLTQKTNEFLGKAVDKENWNNQQQIMNEMLGEDLTTLFDDINKAAVEDERIPITQDMVDTGNGLIQKKIVLDRDIGPKTKAATVQYWMDHDLNVSNKTLSKFLKEYGFKTGGRKQTPKARKRAEKLGLEELLRRDRTQSTKMLRYALDKDSVFHPDDLNPKQKKAFDAVRTMEKIMQAKAVQAGAYDTRKNLKNYLPHRMTKEGRDKVRAIQAQDRTYGTTGFTGDRSRHMKGSLFGANKIYNKDIFETDLRKVMGETAASVQSAIMPYYLARGLIKSGNMKVMNPKLSNDDIKELGPGAVDSNYKPQDFEKVHTWEQLGFAPETVTKLKKIYGSEKVVLPTGAARIVRETLTEMDRNAATKFYDQYMGLWKSSKLLSLGYQFRNAAGAMMNLQLAGFKKRDVMKYANEYDKDIKWYKENKQKMVPMDKSITPEQAMAMTEKGNTTIDELIEKGYLSGDSEMDFLKDISEGNIPSLKRYASYAMKPENLEQSFAQRKNNTGTFKKGKQTKDSNPVYRKNTLTTGQAIENAINNPESPMFGKEKRNIVSNSYSFDGNDTGIHRPENFTPKPKEEQVLGSFPEKDAQKLKDQEALLNLRKGLKEILAKKPQKGKPKKANVAGKKDASDVKKTGYTFNQKRLTKWLNEGAKEGYVPGDVKKADTAEAKRHRKAVAAYNKAKALTDKFPNPANAKKPIWPKAPVFLPYSEKGRHPLADAKGPKNQHRASVYQPKTNSLMEEQELRKLQRIHKQDFENRVLPEFKEKVLKPHAAAKLFSETASPGLQEQVKKAYKTMDSFNEEMLKREPIKNDYLAKEKGNARLLEHTESLRKAKEEALMSKKQQPRLMSVVDLPENAARKAIVENFLKNNNISVNENFSKGESDKVMSKILGKHLGGSIDKIFEKNLEFGALVDNKIRYGAYKSAINDTKATGDLLGKDATGNILEDANRVVDKALFNYNDQSKTMRSMNRLIPFFTWGWRNLQFQSEMMLKNPARINNIVKFVDATYAASEAGTENTPDQYASTGALSKEGLVNMIERDDDTEHAAVEDEYLKWGATPYAALQMLPSVETNPFTGENSLNFEGLALNPILDGLLSAKTGADTFITNQNLYESSSKADIVQSMGEMLGLSQAQIDEAIGYAAEGTDFTGFDKWALDKYGEHPALMNFVNTVRPQVFNSILDLKNAFDGEGPKLPSMTGQQTDKSIAKQNLYERQVILNTLVKGYEATMGEPLPYLYEPMWMKKSTAKNKIKDNIVVTSPSGQKIDVGGSKMPEGFEPNQKQIEKISDHIGDFKSVVGTSNLDTMENNQAIYEAKGKIYDKKDEMFWDIMNPWNDLSHEEQNAAISESEFANLVWEKYKEKYGINY